MGIMMNVTCRNCKKMVICPLEQGSPWGEYCKECGHKYEFDVFDEDGVPLISEGEKKRKTAR